MAAAVVPARERFEPGDAAARQLDQWLKGEVQPVFLDGITQFGFEAEAIVGQHRGFGFVDFDAVGLLRAFQRDLRVPDLIGDIGVSCRLDRTAECAIDADFQFADPEGVIEATADAPRHLAHIGTRRPQCATRWRIRRRRCAPICRRCAGSTSAAARRR